MFSIGFPINQHDMTLDRSENSSAILDGWIHSELLEGKAWGISAAILWESDDGPLELGQCD